MPSQPKSSALLRRGSFSFESYVGLCMLCKERLPESAALFHALHVRPESVAATSSACFTCRPVYCSAVFVSSSLATTVLSEVATVVTTRAIVFEVLHYRKH